MPRSRTGELVVTFAFVERANHSRTAELIGTRTAELIGSRTGELIVTFA